MKTFISLLGTIVVYLLGSLILKSDDKLLIYFTGWFLSAIWTGISVTFLNSKRR